MQVVNVRKTHLRKAGYADFQEWSANPNNLYIGRNMNFYVKGAFASKWQNPFTVKKYGDKCCELYEQHIRSSELYNQLEELRGKTLGCWCHPEKCHGDVLMKLLAEKKN